MDVSFVIPCLNEEESIGAVINEILDSNGLKRFSFEIVVADNGSTDRSVEIAEGLGARVAHIQQRGYGAAVRGGIGAAAGKVVVMADADGSYKFSESERMIELVLSGSAELVMGNRFKGGIADGAMPFLHRKLGNPVLSSLGRLIYRVEISDFHCGLRAFDRDSIMKIGLSSSGMEFASEMVIQASRSGLVSAEHPVTLSPDLRSRPPHLRSWSDGFRHLKLLLRWAPGWVFYPLIFLLLCSGMFIALLGVAGPRSIGPLGVGVRSSGSMLGISLSVITMLHILEVARLTIGKTEGWVRSPFVRFRSSLITIYLMLFTGGIVGISSQALRWVGGDFFDSSNPKSVLWFFFCLLILTGSVISIGFLLLINVIKKIEN